MARRQVMRWLGYPSKRDYGAVAVGETGYGLAAYCYYLALEGGDLEYLKSRMTYFAILLLLSVALVLASVSVHAQINTRNLTLKLLCWGSGLLLMLFVMTVDLGAGLDHHGQFNLMVYFLLWVPICLCALLYYGCSAAKRNIQSGKVFWGGLLLITLFAGLYVVYALDRASRDWYKGLGGQVLDPSGATCGIYPPGAPWVAVLPDRTFNFFSNFQSAGSSECPAVPPFSYMESGVLEVNCDLPQAELVENPDYISMRKDTFVMLETGMELWANQTKQLERRSWIPGHTKVKTEAEWVEVHCGAQSNYHIQSVRNESVIDRLIGQSAAIPANTTRMNLLVFMLDTVSRAQIYRKMPNLVQALETINATGNSQVFQFFRLVSNGFATEMNTKAMYTGSLNRRERSGRPYWNIFREQGNAALYINGFCEDWMSTFLKKEFDGADKFAFLQWCHPDYHPYERTFGNFAGPFSILRRCIKGKHVHNRILDYIRQFWKNYSSW